MPLGLLGVESFVLTGPHGHPDVLIKQVAAFAVLAGACAYLYLTRSRLGPEPLTTSARRLTDQDSVHLSANERLSFNASRVAGNGRTSAKTDPPAPAQPDPAPAQPDPAPAQPDPAPAQPVADQMHTAQPLAGPAFD